MSTKTKSKTKVTIYLSRDGNTDQLYLRDSEGHAGKKTITTDVCCGDEVEWVLGEGIDEVTNIFPKRDSKNIFSAGPSKRPDGNWEGTVSKSAKGSELYSIDYRIGEVAYSDDPRLDVKPPRT
ncbi:hypothetical protein [Catalinimonas niigatensis]|uniref:hypothetical protein n=1 Tax=Catalinimonas niigatensis TaxID=1397264 RepID=UPI0026663274|nr:hypothetical protein [Catalinimonas niigatensis]WPP53283.1 hypothetical protein PZB72_12960 [Catalinimonas niigatensis]